MWPERDTVGPAMPIAGGLAGPKLGCLDAVARIQLLCSEFVKARHSGFNNSFDRVGGCWRLTLTTSMEQLLLLN